MAIRDVLGNLSPSGARASIPDTNAASVPVSSLMFSKDCAFPGMLSSIWVRGTE